MSKDTCYSWFDSVESQFLDYISTWLATNHTHSGVTKLHVQYFELCVALQLLMRIQVALMLASSINLVIQHGPLYRDIKASQKSFAGGANFNLLVELQPTTDKAAGMVGPAVT